MRLERKREMRGKSMLDLALQEPPFWTMRFREGDDDDPNEDVDPDDSDDEDDSDEEITPEKYKALKKEAAAKDVALKKERKLRRAAEKAAKTKAKGKGSEDPDDDAKEKNASERELTKQRKAAAAATAKAERLATRLVKEAEDNLIRKYAVREGFEDPEDAVALVNRADFDIEQDDEDPAEIEIDGDTVEEAVRDLANRKKHLLKSTKKKKDEEDEEEDKEEEEDKPTGKVTGTKFAGGKRPGKPKKLKEEELRDKFPALRTRTRS